MSHHVERRRLIKVRHANRVRYASGAAGRWELTLGYGHVIEQYCPPSVVYPPQWKRCDECPPMHSGNGS